MDLEQLRLIKTLITHANQGAVCPDAMAAALIVRDALPDVKVRFVQYDTPEHKALIPESGVLFCDFTPWVEREPLGKISERGIAQAAKWLAVNAIVLDHHEGVRDLVALFGSRGVYADAVERPGVSGATLAYEEVWAPLYHGLLDEAFDLGRLEPNNVRAFVTLAGVRDTWQTKHPDWRKACAQAAALMFWPREQLLREGLHRVVRDRLDVGEALLKQQAVTDERTIAEAHRFEVSLLHAIIRGGHSQSYLRVVCFEGDSRSASDVAERLKSDVDMVVAWHYFVRDGEAFMKLSCRSCSDFEVLPFAQSLGGNGHARAAGCVVPVRRAGVASALLSDLDPYDFLENKVREFIGRSS